MVSELNTPAEKRVGIVVIGRNEGARLVACLRSIVSVGCKIVYVDSGSTDDSVENARRFGAHVVTLDKALPFTAARARNAGFRALTSIAPNIELVQFVDGDCELVPGWITAAVSFFDRSPHVALVCGRRREKHSKQSAYNRVMDVEWNTPVGQASACGGDSLVRAGVLEAVGGFRDSLIAGEEPELCSRIRAIGWRIWRLDVEMTRHDAAIVHFKQLWTRGVRTGYAEAEIALIEAKRGRGASAFGDLRRPAFWSLFIPLVSLVGGVFFPAFWLLLLIYPMQLIRIAFRVGLRDAWSWQYAFFMLVLKFAELQGIFRYLWTRTTDGTVRLIEYKARSAHD